MSIMSANFHIGTCTQQYVCMYGLFRDDKMTSHYFPLLCRYKASTTPTSGYAYKT